MPQLVYQTGQAEVLSKLKDVDVVCVDFDECLFPYFVQPFIAGGMLLESIVRPSLWKYIPQFLSGAGFMARYLFAVKVLHNDFLMNAYEKVMQGIPVSLIERHAEYVHHFLKPRSLAFLKLFSVRKVPIAVISLSVEVVLNVVKKNVGFIDYFFGNVIEVKKPDNTFLKYATPRMSGGMGKLGKFKELIARHGFKKPLVIGHSEDEVPLMSYARELGGLSIGIQPHKNVIKEFDLVLHSWSWSSLESLAASIEHP